MKIEINNIYSKIFFDPREEKEILKLKKKYSVFAPGAKFTWRYKKRIWDGKVSLIQKIDKYYVVPTGFIPSVLKDINCEIEDHRQTFTINNSEDVNFLRDYQKEAFVKSLTNKLDNLWWPRGIIQLPTGGGKTEVAIAIMKTLNTSTLFLVHRKDLLHQTIKRCKNILNIHIGAIGDGVFDPNPTGITVAMIQTLASKAKDLSWLNNIKCVIVDEAHSIAASLDKGNQFVETLAYLPNAIIRLGLTATPFKRDDYSNYLLEGMTGSVLHKIPTKDLIDSGYLSNAKIKMIEISALDKQVTKELLRMDNKYAKIYELAISCNHKRNNIIAKEAIASQGPVLILVTKIAHGTNILTELLKEDQTRLKGFIHGETTTANRKIMVDNIVKNKGILITTTIFDEGIDIPEIRTLIMAGGGKSEGRQLQRIGRSLRTSKNKSHADVIDFYDMTPILEDHSERREALWIKEGYTVERV